MGAIRTYRWPDLKVWFPPSLCDKLSWWWELLLGSRRAERSHALIAAISGPAPRIAITRFRL
jgi:hypothetical protein